MQTSEQLCLLPSDTKATPGSRISGVRQDKGNPYMFIVLHLQQGALVQPHSCQFRLSRVTASSLHLRIVPPMPPDVVHLQSMVIKYSGADVNVLTSRRPPWQI